MIDKLSSQNISLTSRTTQIDETTKAIHRNEITNNDGFSLKKGGQVKEEQVTEVIESMNKFLQASHTSLKFELHEELNEYYVTLVDEVTQEVVREIPSKKILDVYAAMTEFLGLMVDKKI
ncbi:flagellar protein FlaG [Cytobacillus oceanisediminis]|uniref:flagellar protein FlaG n=1 Tax=Cytobacillus oceanisediminis TaxID=665099 RepID=UPI00203A7930|nr:flagellar protein FlaG [Cytobacillus oceanisediminis]MCM3403697.1 flagellar protein FlaG [Cytobacillus oceanisediminis]MDK7666787.1 flagellar protein FlaG [Cytobacillus oceanisediminis]